ncbi:MAG: T9SS type A sorting domain-containing protein [Bacteroidales bacterium]|nr:T9SS type A sorting domain-containing protein [Bacteroidales bacterium]MBN2763999.1 T9SS type A sorting domain-containing protein [Bacteroidales bacterium]
MNFTADKKIPIPLFFVSLIFVLTFQKIFSQEPLRIMPLGNSITFDARIYESRGDWEKISYRYTLHQLLTGDQFKIDMVGSRRAGWAYFDDCDNAGWPGIRDGQLADIIESGTTAQPFGKITNGPYLDYYPADVILLEIGTNDILANDYNTVADVARLLDAVDDYEQRTGKAVLVILAQIISLQNYACGTETRIVTYNAHLETLAANRISAGDKIILVDMECGAGINYYSSDMYDAYHPGPSGYDKMASVWHNALKSLSTPPTVSDIPDKTVTEGTNFPNIYLDNYVYDPDDQDSDITWYISPSEPEHFTVTIDANRIATVTAKDPDWNGTENIAFIAADKGRIVPNLRRYDEDMASFTVTPVNDPPVILEQITNLTMQEDSSLDLVISYLDVQDIDNPPSDLTITVKSGTNYTFSGNRITPAADYNGNITVNVAVNDLQSQSTEFQMLVSVDPVNDPPQLMLPFDRTADENILYEQNITISDIDDGDMLTMTPVILPSWCNFNSQSGRLYGTPLKSHTGDHLVKIRGSDGTVNIDSSFSITVNKANNKPYITSTPPDKAYVGSQYSYEITAQDDDQEDILAFFSPEIPSWLQFQNETGLLTGIPLNSLIGLYDVSLGVTDGKDTTLQDFVIQVAMPSGINGIIKDELVILPNPAGKTVNIYCSEGISFSSVEFYNLSGELVFSRNSFPYEKSNTVRLESLNIMPGIYICRVLTSEGIKQTKIVFR